MCRESVEAQSNDKRNLTCGDLEILLLVIRLGVTGLKKKQQMFLLHLLGRRGRRGGLI